MDTDVKQEMLSLVDALRHILPLDILNDTGNDTSKILNRMETLLNDQTTQI